MDLLDLQERGQTGVSTILESDSELAARCDVAIGPGQVGQTRDPGRVYPGTQQRLLVSSQEPHSIRVEGHAIDDLVNLRHRNCGGAAIEGTGCK